MVSVVDNQGVVSANETESEQSSTSLNKNLSVESKVVVFVSECNLSDKTVHCNKIIQRRAVSPANTKQVKLNRGTGTIARIRASSTGQQRTGTTNRMQYKYFACTIPCSADLTRRFGLPGQRDTIEDTTNNFQRSGVSGQWISRSGTRREREREREREKETTNSTTSRTTTNLVPSPRGAEKLRQRSEASGDSRSEGIRRIHKTRGSSEGDILPRVACIMHEQARPDQAHGTRLLHLLSQPLSFLSLAESINSKNCIPSSSRRWTLTTCLWQLIADHNE